MQRAQPLLETAPTLVSATDEEDDDGGLLSVGVEPQPLACKTPQCKPTTLGLRPPAVFMPFAKRDTPPTGVVLGK
eukprot:5091373-Amphidinium_carterae.1